MPQKKGAVVLLSGGLDSSTTLAIAREQEFDVYALTIYYGQKNPLELQRAEQIAAQYGVVEHKTITIDLRTFGGSSLTSDREIERDRSLEEIGRQIPSTYVPARNTLLLSYALAWAEVLQVRDIFIGVNAMDTSGYPDCRPQFIEAFTALANVATKLGTELGQTITIHAPLQNLSKAQIIKEGLRLGIDYSITNTCYDPAPDGIACGTCDACILRQRGFHELRLIDPLPYAKALPPPWEETATAKNKGNLAGS